MLAGQIEGFLAEAHVPPATGRLVGAIAPHAGYVYSGPTAAYTYRLIRDHAVTGGAPECVVVLGFSHRSPFRGIALLDGACLATPLGEAALDAQANAFLAAADPRIVPDGRPHSGEHSAENQVPFLQAVLPGIPLVLALIGTHDMALVEALTAALDKLGRQKRILVIASSDMLHDPVHERVRKTDQATLRKVAALDVTGVLHDWDYTQQVFCGIAPVATVMRYAKLQGCTKGTVLRYRNSGDDFPESRGQWVVGYGAVAFTV
jgi:AmmeMemoRadiSam system protein B